MVTTPWKGTAMKLRNVFAVTTAALIGLTSAGFAQAAGRDGNWGGRHYSGDRHGGHHGYHRNHRGSSDRLALALGIGLLGAAIASHSYSQPYYGYAPAYPARTYGNYGYRYSQPYYGYAQPDYLYTP
jgi:hypothetical protein